METNIYHQILKSAARHSVKISTSNKNPANNPASNENSRQVKIQENFKTEEEQKLLIIL